ncbi:MAG: sulfite exporter TauE/SafE family protein [Hyphomicrobiales bacterium]
MVLSVESVLLVTFVFMFGGFVKGTIGLGLPVVALAFLAAPLGLETAMAIMLAPITLTNLWQAVVGPHLITLIKRLWTFLVAAMVGIWIGVSVLAERSELLLGLLGIILCIYSLTYFSGFRMPPPGKREWAYSPLAGGLGGLMFGMTGNLLVPGILYVQALGMKRDMLVQALGLIFFTVSSTLSISFLFHNLLSMETNLLSLYAVIPSVVGLILGQRYRHKISEEKFTRLFFIGLLITALYMIWRAFF